MTPIALKNNSLEALFLPEVGMNMISYKKGGLEIIDQSTKNLFEERSAGLGPLIGPHFHWRKVIPPIADESLFPHIARVKSKGVQEPFSHGIARYAPWKVEKATPTMLRGVLTGKDTWHDVPLAALEGQNFKMEFCAELLPEGLKIDLSVVSEADSLVGIHYYYRLPQGTSVVKSAVKEHYLNQSEPQKIPPEWGYDGHRLAFDLRRGADYTFFPYPDPIHAEIVLETGEYRLKTSYSCICQENCWQLYHPEGASFACIEPISSQDPRHPNLTVSALSIQLSIED